MAVPTLAVLQIVVLEVVALRWARLRLEPPRPEEVPVRASPLQQMRECEQKQLPQSPWKWSLRGRGTMAVFRREMVLPQEDEAPVGQLFISERPVGVVVWGNDTTGERYSPQAVRLAEELTKCDLAILLLGLRTRVEEELLAGWGVDDEECLQRAARRLERTCGLLARDAQTQGMRVGLFGTGSGAAASLLAAARHPAELSAIACCGGRPSLAGAAAARVQVPTLLVVGSEDERGLLEAQRLSRELAGEHSLRLVPGASRAFREPGAWEDAVRITGEWFHDHFRAAVEPRSGWTDAEGRFV